jgi:membrane-associated phospholipid phosphatase
LNRYRWFSLSFVILVLFSAALFLHPHDRTLLLQIQESHDPGLDRIAAEVSHWGDFLFFNIGGAMFIWLFGYVRGLRWVQRLAYSALFGAICAGVVCNAFRLTMGRARPKAMVADRFYGFQGTLQGWNYHGFPSGHTSTAFGAGVPLATAAGVWGAPILVVSGTVGWSRLYKNQHYPTDVFVGAALGLLFGTATSWHLRKVRLRLKRSKRRQKRSSAIDPDFTRHPSGNRKSLFWVPGASRHRDREFSIGVR